MAGKVDLRAAVGEAFDFAAVAWRRSPVGCALIALALLVPTLLGERPVSIWVGLPLSLGQALVALVGWTSLLRAAMSAPADPAAQGRDAARLLGSVFLNGLFLSLILIVLALMILGIAGATGLSEGDDPSMAAYAAVAGSGWETFVLLALNIAAVLLMLSLSARLLAAGPGSIAEGRVVSLQALNWTRGSGVKPALGLIVALAPIWVLTLSALLVPFQGVWIDWVWAGVLAFIQAPLLAGYSVGLWRSVRSGEPS